MNKDQRVDFWYSCYLNISLAILTLTLGTPSALAERESPLQQGGETIPQLSLKILNQFSPPQNRPSETEEEPLDFSDTGRSGQQTAGETRSGQCADVSIPVTALVPSSNSGKTSATHPQLWFYIPYGAKDVSRVEFVMQDSDRKDISRQSWQPQNIPGYISASLPETEPALESNKSYRWYLKVYCQTHASLGQQAPLFVQGWLDKTEVSKDVSLQVQPEQSPHMIYAQHNLWFDAIDSLFTLLNSHAIAESLVSGEIAPNNSEIRANWERIINAQGVDLELPELETTELFVRQN